MSFVRVRDESRRHRRLAHLALLQALPAVGVREHEHDVVLNRVPEALPVAVRLADVAPGTPEEVAQKVRQDVDGGKVGRERLEIPLGDRFGVEMLGAQMQLEPEGDLARARCLAVRVAYHSINTRSSSSAVSSMPGAVASAPAEWSVPS